MGDKCVSVQVHTHNTIPWGGIGTGVWLREGSLHRRVPTSQRPAGWEQDGRANWSLVHTHDNQSTGRYSYNMPCSAKCGREGWAMCHAQMAWFRDLRVCMAWMWSMSAMQTARHKQTVVDTTEPTSHYTQHSWDTVVHSQAELSIHSLWISDSQQSAYS